MRTNINARRHKRQQLLGRSKMQNYNPCATGGDQSSPDRAINCATTAAPSPNKKKNLVGHTSSIINATVSKSPAFSTLQWPRTLPPNREVYITAGPGSGFFGHSKHEQNGQVLVQEIARASSNTTKNIENPQASNTFEMLATQMVSAIRTKHCSSR